MFYLNYQILHLPVRYPNLLKKMICHCDEQRGSGIWAKKQPRRRTLRRDCHAIARNDKWFKNV